MHQMAAAAQGKDLSTKSVLQERKKRKKKRKQREISFLKQQQKQSDAAVTTVQAQFRISTLTHSDSGTITTQSAKGKQGLGKAPRQNLRRTLQNKRKPSLRPTGSLPRDFKQRQHRNLWKRGCCTVSVCVPQTSPCHSPTRDRSPTCGVTRVQLRSLPRLYVADRSFQHRPTTH